MIRLKQEPEAYRATIRHLSPPAIFALIGVVDPIFEKYGEETIITSGEDGVHSRKSLHYRGDAFDVDLIGDGAGPGGTLEEMSESEEARMIEITQEIRERLGRDWDVVLEETHLHLEFQPKGPIPYNRE